MCALAFHFCMKHSTMKWCFSWLVRGNSQYSYSTIRQQTNSCLVNLLTRQLADYSIRRQRIFQNYGKTTLYLYTKPNTIKYWKHTINVIYPNSYAERLFTPNFLSNIPASWLDCKLPSPQPDWLRVGLSANCPVEPKFHLLHHVTTRHNI